jgi:hypothetical protein
MPNTPNNKQKQGMPDIERLTRKLEARRVSLAELCQLYRASSALPRIEDALRCHEGAGAALLAERCGFRGFCQCMLSGGARVCGVDNTLPLSQHTHTQNKQQNATALPRRSRARTTPTT